jgi:hypothetical protein
MTINGSTTGYGISDEMAQPTVNYRTEQEKAGQAEAKQEDQQVQQSQASAADRPSQRAAPGRRPLFRS